MDYVDENDNTLEFLCHVLNITGIFPPDSYSSRRNPSTDALLFSVCVTYLAVVKGYSVEHISAFTTYNFVNFHCTGYKDWKLSENEHQMLELYFRRVRGSWVCESDHDIPAQFVSSPCGNFSSSTSPFFVNSKGVPEAAMDVKLGGALMTGNVPPLNSIASPSSFAKKSRRTSRASSTSGDRDFFYGTQAPSIARSANACIREVHDTRMDRPRG